MPHWLRFVAIKKTTSSPNCILLPQINTELPVNFLPSIPARHLGNILPNLTRDLNTNVYRKCVSDVLEITSHLFTCRTGFSTWWWNFISVLTALKFLRRLKKHIVKPVLWCTSYSSFNYGRLDSPLSEYHESTDR